MSIHNTFQVEFPQNLRQWWQKSVVYQIYWRSFQDSNGDGIGDLAGVLQRLDYIESLGIDVIWFNPFYESPDVDNGYDISDYYRVMAKAGTLEQSRQLLQACQARGIKVILDLVVNHSSDQHAWFVASQDPESPYRNYYIWKEGTADQPPNNWRSWFEPSAWKYHEASQSYYFHSFATAQPDFNWENPKLRQDLFAMMRYWLTQGISGFRLDVINMIGKSESWMSAEDPYHLSYLTNHPVTHDYLQELNREVLSQGDYLTVGEAPFVSAEEALDYVGFDRKELSMLFHFDVMNELVTWDAKVFRSIQQRWHQSTYRKAWVAQYLNNHDQARSVSRYGDDQEYRVASAKMLAIMTHLLPGTPFVYQGEEIGMTNCYFEDVHDYKDIFLLNRYQELCDEGVDPQEALASLRFLSRDNARTPMQWNESSYAGFTDDQSHPWIKINPNASHIHVEQAEQDPNSVLHFYRRLITLRKQHDVMVWGDYWDITPDDDQLYCFMRVLEGVGFLVVLNTGKETRTYTFPYQVKEVILGNYPLTWYEDHDEGMAENHYENNEIQDAEQRKEDDSRQPLRQSLHLKPYEAQILAVYPSNQ